MHVKLEVEGSEMRHVDKEGFRILVAEPRPTFGQRKV